jgi:hypothetical protein
MLEGEAGVALGAELSAPQARRHVERRASAFLALLGQDAARLSVVRARITCLALTGAVALDSVRPSDLYTGGWLPMLGCIVATVLVSGSMARTGSALASMAALWNAWLLWPTTPNHTCALALGQALCTWSIWRGTSREAGPEQLVRWLAFSILFWSGVQKLLHESYWYGQFLAAAVATGEARWRWFRNLMEPEEVERLSKAGLEGPFVLESLMALTVSRALPLLEMALALGLLWRNARRSAVLLSLLLVASMQAVAGEMTFAVAMCGLLGALLDLRVATLLMRVLLLASAALACIVLYFPGSLRN